MDCVREKLTSGSVMVAAEENHPSGGDLLPQNPSMDSSDEAEAYHSNQTCSPRKTSASSNISSSEIIIDRESTSYSESFKFQFNGGKNCLPVNTEEQEKSEVASEQTSLLGYCKEGGERILVYVFMAHASLHNDLHGKNKALKEKLDWVKRVTIAVQAARETLQENSGILTDIPTENEILGISRGISEDIPRKHKIWFPRNIPTEFRENINPSEYSYGIPRKNVFLGKNR
ncbi:unnamed protein product [Brassica napus]|uniref:(rape) hypothetical protein n=1 Tax=Brassica napus TaxID=3708 RepID=A0A816QBA6_BRANA|nr:unnamed protein product [Brassica napus]